MRKNKGITLIALVITIIVLLILAGVSIAFLTGDNGILTRASTSSKEYNYQSAVESLKVKLQEVNLNVISATGKKATLHDVYDSFKDQNNITVIGVRNQIASILAGITWSDNINEVLVKLADYPNYIFGIDQNLNIIDEQELANNENYITITYDSNGGTGNIENTKLMKIGNSATGNITNDYFTRTAYTLLGFSEDKNATTATYIRGNSYSFTNDTTLYAIWGVLQYSNYSATGNYQTYAAKNNMVYQIECWGASGGVIGSSGYWMNGQQTNGAYTSGRIMPNIDTNLYIYVGKAGAYSPYTDNSEAIEYITQGGWNGGGDNYASGYGISGGGATDVRISSTSTQNVWKETASLASRIMVAAGAGGVGGYGIGGNGGGIFSENTSMNTGTSAYGYPYTSHGYSTQSGSTQTSSGSILQIAFMSKRSRFTYNDCFVGGFGYGGFGIGQWCAGAGGRRRLVWWCWFK